MVLVYVFNSSAKQAQGNELIHITLYQQEPPNQKFENGNHLQLSFLPIKLSRLPSKIYIDKNNNNDNHLPFIIWVDKILLLLTGKSSLLEINLAFNGSDKGEEFWACSQVEASWTAKPAL